MRTESEKKSLFKRIEKLRAKNWPLKDALTKIGIPAPTYHTWKKVYKTDIDQMIGTIPVSSGKMPSKKYKKKNSSSSHAGHMVLSLDQWKALQDSGLLK